MEENSNGELAFLETLLKRDNVRIPAFASRLPMHSDQYLPHSSNHQESSKEIFVHSLFNRAYSIITNKVNITKENARIKQLLNWNEYHESILVKSLRDLLKITVCFFLKNKCNPQISNSKRPE